jgi:acyl-CoA reductase-like NAD-dependent aldehyde dehydrogenase
VAAAGGIATAIAAMSSAAVADVTGILAASSAALAAFLALRQRRKILHAYQDQMETKRSELVKTIEQQLQEAIAVFYKQVSTAFEPLGAFCLAQRRTYEPLLHRAEELQQTFEALRRRLG